MSIGSLGEYLQELSDPSRALKASDLLRLSGLEAEEQAGLQGSWASIGTERRREIVSRLVDMAEDNVELDFDAFFRHCLQDADPVVRERSLSGLWETDDRSVIPLFIACLEKDTDMSVRAAAATALGRFASIAESGKVSPRDSERIYQALMCCLRDNPEEPLEVRRRALEAAGAFNSGEVKELVRLGYQSSELSLRQSALFAMGRSADTSWLPVILQELKSPEPAMRYEAANASRELGEEAAVPHLAPLTQDEDLQVQLSAIQALGGIGGSRAGNVLKRCARSPDDAVREAAEEALQMIEMEEDPLDYRPFR